MVICSYFKISKVIICFLVSLEERCEPSIPLLRNTGTNRYCPDINSWVALDQYEIGNGYDSIVPTTTSRSRYVDRNRNNDFDRNRNNNFDRNRNNNFDRNGDRRGQPPPPYVPEPNDDYEH